MKRTRLKRKSDNPAAQAKDRIQALLRAIVIKRDKGCILRDVRITHDEVLQADHLITRANSATYADYRLVVCLCRSCHGWKHWHHKEYDALVKTLLPKDRTDLWDRCERDSWKPKRTSASDWLLEEAALKQQLARYDRD